VCTYFSRIISSSRGTVGKKEIKLAKLDRKFLEIPYVPKFKNYPKLKTLNEIKCSLALAC
jgi:hypothetical protein